MRPAEIEAALGSPSFHQDPYPIYRALQEEAPVYWSEVLQAWMVTRFDDVVSLVRDHGRLSSRGRLTALLDRVPEEQRRLISPMRDHFAIPGLIHSDPPDHNRLRGLISRAFAAGVIERLRPRVVEIVNELLAGTSGHSSVDLLEVLAYPLPAIVIAELLGAPAKDRALFKTWSDAIVAFQGSGEAKVEALTRSQDGLLGMREYLDALIADRRKHPSDDILGILVDAEQAGDRLTTDELLSTCVTFLIAGHETTTSLIASGIATLLRNAAELERLRGDARLLLPAIEECLRYESPIQRVFRLAVADIEVRGKTIRSGQTVLLMVGAANRDARVFVDPDTFDVARATNRHLAFGTGIHYCLGAPLARLEASIALPAVLNRWPMLSLATTELRWQSEKDLFRCPEALPVELGRESRGSPRRSGSGQREEPAVSERWVEIGAVSEMPIGTLRRIDVDGMALVLVHTGDGFHALGAECTHEQADLSEGEVDETSITCPLHYSRFALEDGRPLEPPADAALSVYPVQVENERILVRSTPR